MLDQYKPAFAIAMRKILISRYLMKNEFIIFLNLNQIKKQFNLIRKQSE